MADFQLPQSRLEIVRHFSFQSHTITVELSDVDDIFDLRVPRLHIVRSNGFCNRLDIPSEPKGISEGTPIIAVGTHEEKKVLKREIKSWWQGVAEHMDKLVSHLPIPNT